VTIRETEAGSEPSKLPAAWEPPELGTVRDCHCLLMIWYVATLEAIYQRKPSFPFLGTYPQTLHSLAWWALPEMYLTPLLVQAHIKKRLRTLHSSYVQLEQTLNFEPDDPSRAWLREARDGCKKFADTLASVRLLSLLAPTPALIGIATQLKLGVDTWKAIVLWGLVYPLTLGLIVLFASFDTKRRILLGVADSEDNSESLANVYRVEDSLFRALHRRTPRETQIDVLLFSYLLLALLVASIALALSSSSSKALAWGGIAFGVIALVIFLPHGRKVVKKRRAQMFEPRA
jgi:hypothetical protein